jgi:hypothetical protein
VPISSQRKFRVTQAHHPTSTSTESWLKWNLVRYKFTLVSKKTLQSLGRITPMANLNMGQITSMSLSKPRI